jgi:hypothetical protein
LFLGYANIPIFCAAEKGGSGEAAAAGCSLAVEGVAGGVVNSPELPDSEFLQPPLNSRRDRMLIT